LDNSQGEIEAHLLRLNQKSAAVKTRVMTMIVKIGWKRKTILTTT
jgi:hypothetical protein